MDLVAAGGRVHASEIDMEALARQSASFCTVNPDDSPDALARENEQLKLRLAAEQQCLLREQHITARMWIEKSQAEERAVAASNRAAVFEAQVAGWEAWLQSQKRQKRQQRQQLLKGWRESPDEVLRLILEQLDILSVRVIVEPRSK